jgi:signal transduction histidine kinase
VRLRARIAITTLLVAAPMLVTVAWVKARFFEEAETDALSRGLVELMVHGGRAACEREPETWRLDAHLPVPLPGGEVHRDEPILVPLSQQAAEGLRAGPLGVFAYEERFVARNPAAPTIDEALRERIARDAVAARHVAGEPPIVEVLVRMPWRAGPCAMLLLRQPELRLDRSWREVLPVRIWAVVLLLSVVAVVLGLGPAVRRIRRLTREVRASARAGYVPTLTVRGDDEIGDLARTFGEAAREIRAQMAAQERREHTLREFLDNTTHDMMTPLTVLHGLLAALATGAEPEQRVRVNGAMDQAHYMAALLHNLAIAAKLEAGEPDLRREPVDLGAIVARVVARHRPIADNHGVVLERGTPEEAMRALGDVTFVEQAVSNLVLNAIQHVERGGHVAVTLDRVASARFVIKVIDDGPGMSAAELMRVVERGQRGNQARTRAPNGRGVGLDIVHRVVLLHGWELTLAAIPPHGLSVAIAGPVA